MNHHHESSVQRLFTVTVTDNLKLFNLNLNLKANDSQMRLWTLEGVLSPLSRCAGGPSTVLSGTVWGYLGPSTVSDEYE